MKRIWSVAAVAATLLAGCENKKSDELIFVKSAGGQSAEPSASDPQLAADKKACMEEVKKAALGVPPAYYQGLDGAITPVMISDRNTRGLLEIMKGCMGEKGYVLAPKP